jgi:phosphoribosylglycinamide formyltransferase-1
LFKAIRQAGFSREIPLIIHTLKAISDGRIAIGKDNILRDNEGGAIQGYDLTAEIDAVITSPHSSDK